MNQLINNSMLSTDPSSNKAHLFAQPTRTHPNKNTNFETKISERAEYAQSFEFARPSRTFEVGL